MLDYSIHSSKGASLSKQLQVWTSAGMTACIDLALAIVEKDYGVDLARTLAQKLVICHRRGGGQSQHSELLKMDAKSDRI
jgi:transcriptional regulator GlxA family with amidase domain